MKHLLCLEHICSNCIIHVGIQLATSKTFTKSVISAPSLTGMLPAESVVLKNGGFTVQPSDNSGIPAAGELWYSWCDQKNHYYHACICDDALPKILLMHL